MNTLADFPSDRFEIYAYCACGRSTRVDTAAVPADLSMDLFKVLLR